MTVYITSGHWDCGDGPEYDVFGVYKTREEAYKEIEELFEADMDALEWDYTNPDDFTFYKSDITISALENFNYRFIEYNVFEKEI